METASAHPDVCGGESRSYMIMEGTLEDYASIWASISAAPDRQAGQHCKPWSPEEDWILWAMWTRKRQPDTAKALGRSAGTCRMRYEELKKQDGPRGERPEWMK